MVYNNLLYFLIAIFSISMASVPEKPNLPVWAIVPAFLILLFAFDRYVLILFRRYRGQQASGYFKAETRGSIGALVLFEVFVFGLDLNYYLQFFSFGGAVPALADIAGIVFFLLLFAMLWRRALPNYELVFSRTYSTRQFILSNIRANLPIILPWMILTLCYDLVALLDWPWMQKLGESRWGDLVFLMSFLVFVFVFFPPLVRRLWNCKRLPDGPLRTHLVDFCQRQNFTAEFYLWPLFEGRVITAGVMGVVPGLRYLLITPALLETMSIDELDSVMAHEIGHVKRFHLLLYVFLISGFIISTGFLSEPLFYSFFSKDYFYSFLRFTGFSPDVVRDILVVVPTLLCLLVFIRYIFGYFMRNFERQADLHVIPVLGDSRAIISAFEKIAMLSGNIREEPSWHHFGIGERIRFLLQCENQPERIKQHHRKVLLSLVLYVVVLGGLLFGVQQIPLDDAKDAFELKYIRADLSYNAEQEDSPAQWLFFAGNYLIEHKLEKRAVIAFELAMEKAPQQPELQNNFAWLLLTSSDRSLRDPVKALNLAKRAAAAKPHGYILDTLGMAWWANGYVEEAVNIERQAQFVNPEQFDYFESQIKRFQSGTYRDELAHDTSESSLSEIQQIEEVQI